MDQSFHHRTVRRSNESIELQPLHQTASSSGIKTPKGVLRRMPRVRSDEMTNEDYRQPSVDKSPSPIGAGLPLLQRLKMLKEKQVKGYNYFLVHRYTFVLIFCVNLYTLGDHYRLLFILCQTCT